MGNPAAFLDVTLSNIERSNTRLPIDTVLNPNLILHSMIKLSETQPTHKSTLYGPMELYAAPAVFRIFFF